MEQQQYKTTIEASREIVWDVLWNDASYPLWTSIFSAGSVAKTDWKEGSKVLFLNGEGEGMVSIIAEKRPNEFMSFKHIGIIKDDVEDLDSEAVRAWAGALENYTLQLVDGKTELTVDMDIEEKHIAHFDEIWSKALEKVKELAEARS